MKKVNIFVVLLCIIATTCVGITSCSSDDKIEQTVELILGKFIINDKSLGYESIELFNSGSYIVTLVDNDSEDLGSTDIVSPDELTLSSGAIIFGSDVINNVTRSSTSSKNIYGSYTRLSDFVYDLDGFGILTIDMDKNEVNSFNIILENGKEITMGVSRQNEYANSTATNELCNEWIAKVFEERYYDGEELVYHIKYTVGKSTLDISYDPNNAYTYQLNSFIERYKVEGSKSVIFSKAGTYAVLKNNGSLSYAKWWWKNEANRQMYYSWGEKEEDEEAAYVKLKFNKNELFVHEIYYDFYGGNGSINKTIRRESYITLERK